LTTKPALGYRIIIIFVYRNSRTSKKTRLTFNLGWSLSQSLARFIMDEAGTV
jgi:hypothetical protein